MVSFSILPDRGLLTVGGADRSSFLQGLISNDINSVTPDCAIWSALLTPQGKYLYDFFITEFEGRYLLDCEASRLMDLGRRLSKYKLRASVDLGKEEGMVVLAVYGAGVGAYFGLTKNPGEVGAFRDGIAFVDPRLADMGVRTFLGKESAKAALESIDLEEVSAESYDTFRLGLGIPDGSRDMIVDKSILLESNFEELNGVDWEKGCYMGQELTARTKYRGLLKKRMVPVDIEGREPSLGAGIFCDKRQVGEMRSTRAGLGIALMRLEYLERAITGEIKLVAEGSIITPRKPEWANF